MSSTLKVLGLARHVAESIEVSLDERKGRITKAAYDLAPGELVFDEDPLFVVNPDLIDATLVENIEQICGAVRMETLKNRNTPLNLSELDQELSVTDNANPSIFYPLLEYVKLSQDKRQIVLGMYSPQNKAISKDFCFSVQKVLKMLIDGRVISREQQHDLREDFAYLQHVRGDSWDVDLEEDTAVSVLLEVAKIARTNIFAVSDDGNSSALCVGAALLSHSCLPNCNWHFNLNHGRPRFELRAAVSILKGQELTHSYLHDERWRGEQQRKIALWESKWMHCTCVRCLQPDLSRGFQCPRCGEGTVFLQGTALERSALACTKCTKQLSETQMKELVHKEKSLESKVLSVDSNFSQLATPDMMRALQEASTDLTQHWLKAKVDGLLFEVSKASLMWASAHAYARRREQVATAIYPVASAVRAWQFEDVGDSLAGSLAVDPAEFLPMDYVEQLRAAHGQIGKPKDNGSSMPEESVRKAELLNAYEEALNNLVLVYGSSHEHCRHMETKVRRWRAELNATSKSSHRAHETQRIPLQASSTSCTVVDLEELD